MRRVLAPVLPLLALLLAIVPAASAATSTARVIGGVTATPSDAPWQALVLPAGYICGGSILDATHVVTAAHCVYDEVAQAIVNPGDVTVRAGITDRLVAGGQSSAVTAVSIYPGYLPYEETGDAAILTLATPLTFTSDVQNVDLTDVGWRPVDGVTDLRLSGWGSTVARSPYDDASSATASRWLKVVKTLTSTDGCASVYDGFFDDAKLLCAGEANLDACQGDSGGPLAVQDNGIWKLAGIVTGGAGCGWAGYPGFYARVSEPGIHDYLLTRGANAHIEDPYFTRQPAIVGEALPGHTVECDSGDAANAYAYSIALAENGVITDEFSTVMDLDDGDVGATISSVVVAYGLTGKVQATSPGVLVRSAQPVMAPPAAPRPVAPKPVAPTPTAPADTAAPTTRVLRSHCTRTSCTFDVRADDPAPTLGVKGVAASVKTAYRTTCRVKGKPKRCTKTTTRKLRPVLTTVANTYRFTTPKLRKGTHTFTIVATDVAGHRQAAPTTFKRTTR
jgi:hypothetical protein